MSPLLLLGISFLIIMLAYGGYLFIKKSSVQANIESSAATKIELQNELTVYQEKNLEEAISAKKMMDYLDVNNVKWSYIIKEIRNTLPKADTGEYLVDVLSYSGTSDNKISMNMQTVPNVSEPYSTVAGVIEAFDGSKSFGDNFVASIGGGLTPFGQQILTFALTTTYVGDNGPADSTPTVKKVDNAGAATDVTTDAAADKKPVSR